MVQKIVSTIICFPIFWSVYKPATFRYPKYLILTREIRHRRNRLTGFCLTFLLFCLSFYCRTSYYGDTSMSVWSIQLNQQQCVMCCNTWITAQFVSDCFSEEHNTPFNLQVLMRKQPKNLLSHIWREISMSLNLVLRSLHLSSRARSVYTFQLQMNSEITEKQWLLWFYHRHAKSTLDCWRCAGISFVFSPLPWKRLVWVYNEEPSMSRDMHACIHNVVK